MWPLNTLDPTNKAGSLFSESRKSSTLISKDFWRVILNGKLAEDNMRLRAFSAVACAAQIETLKINYDQ